MDACWSIVVDDEVIWNQGKVVRPSQLITSVRRTWVAEAGRNEDAIGGNMFETVTRPESRSTFLWPNVSDTSGAEDGIRFGYWCAYFVAGVTGATGIPRVLGQARLSLADAVVFALIGAGIQKKWRTAAVIGLILYSANLILTLSQSLAMSAIGIFVFFGFVAAVRGTFAYHRLTHQTQTTREGKVE